MNAMKGAPLDGLTIVDLSQFLAGPYASLRLQDLGARVIKIERPDGGDLTRRLYLSDTMIDGESTMFQAINRGKESLSLNLKSANDVARLQVLIKHADVFLQNFRPGVIERLGLSYDRVSMINPAIVYGSISGYGTAGPLVRYPGQDLLAQARSGVMWLNGSQHDGPVPFGLAVADMLAGANMAQGILAALVRRGISGKGAHVETSLIEAMADFQFEVLTTHLNDGGRLPQRAEHRSAHAGLAAPYGVYESKDGFLALAMTPIDQLARLFDSDALRAFANKPDTWFTQRDDIKAIIADIVYRQPTDHWLAVLEPEGVWCAKVADWPEFLSSEGFKALDMIQTLSNSPGTDITLMRGPIRIDGLRSSSHRIAPAIGEHNVSLCEEFGFKLTETKKRESET